MFDNCIYCSSISVYYLLSFSVISLLIFKKKYRKTNLLFFYLFFETHISIHDYLFFYYYAFKKKGLKLLQEQVEGLETMSDDIIDAAKKQAILTLQYGVPYLPNGSDQWRKDLEAGKSDETLKKLTSNMTKQVAAVTGVPETVVNASIESKTGVKTGPSIGDQMTSGVSSGVSGVTGMFNGKQENATENGDVEMVAVEINDQDEIKNAEIAPVEDEEKKMNEDIEVPITSEQASLLAEFRAPKQPEEYWYENHMCIFKFLFIMCALNVVLAIATILLPI